MGLEDPFYIPELDQTNPAEVDDISEGDDHLRRLKRAIQGSFPNFVGVQGGTPAEDQAVQLTEAQLNQALQKDVAQTVTGDLTVDALLQVLNRGSWDNSAIVGGGDNPTGDETQRAIRQFMALFGPTIAAQTDPATGGYFIINATTNQAGDYTGSTAFTPAVLLQAFGATIVAARTLALGGAHTFTRDETEVRMGYRNPQPFDVTANYTTTAEDESRVLQCNAANEITVTVAAAEAVGTEYTIVNRSAVNDVNVVGSGVSLELLRGGSGAGSPLVLAPLSVMQLYFRSTNVAQVWGNGIS